MIGSGESVGSVAQPVAVGTRLAEVVTRTKPLVVMQAATRAGGGAGAATMTVATNRAATGEEMATTTAALAVGRALDRARPVDGTRGGGSIEIVVTDQTATAANVTEAAGMMIVARPESVRPHLNPLKMSEIAALFLFSSLQPVCVPAN